MKSDSVFIEEVPTNPWSIVDKKEGEAFVKERNRQVKEYKDQMYKNLTDTFGEDFAKTRKEYDAQHTDYSQP